MKNFTLKALFLFFAFCISNLNAQDKDNASRKLFNQDLTPANLESLEQTGHIRCGTVEYENYLLEKKSKKSSRQEFEDWLAPKIEEIKAQRGPAVIQTIPIIFHIFTDGVGAENLSEATIQAQVDQLNIDYGNTAGSSYTQAADTEVVFCLAQQDPNGVQLNELGINRITTYGGGPFADTDFENTLKAATQWDPTKYFNVWVGDLSGGLLGYAHWPENTTLTGVPANTAGASNDGVVIVYSSVGSIANPNPNGGVYASGRTLSHEAGHWLGLRHIWGDTSTCTDDDYCPDTPDASASNFGCPTGTDSCTIPPSTPDMIENYMDYTDDTCMNTFTADQKTRILAVLANSPRRMELVTSNVCNPAQVYNLDGDIKIDNLNLIDCTNGSITPSLTITNRGNNQLTSATINYYLDSNTPTAYSWTGSLNINEFETIALPMMSVAIGTHTFNVELTNPNGGTDEQLGNNNKSQTFNVTGSVCASVANTTYLTSTEGVIFNTLSNLNTGKPSGYSDYTSMSTTINIDTSYDLTVNMNTDGNYTCVSTVWIDWNQNCSFDDAGEQYDLGTALNVANGPSSNSPLSITVPSNATLGATLMRVTTKYSTAATSCENGHDAEVEDYTVIVESNLSVDENSLSSLSIYPNPVNDILTIKTSDNNLPDNYKIFNVLGQTITERSISNVSDLEINTSNLSNGMYFIKVSKNNNATTLQFIKN